jgi:trehalose 6-phosphate phosphatase
MPQPDEAALFLDLDGTLIEFAQTPDAVIIDDHLPSLLRDLAGATGGALAIVSGRPVAAIDALLGLPELAVVGQHGAEVRHADARMEQTVTATPELDWAREQVMALAPAAPGLLIEDKGIALAFHYRESPRVEPLARELAALALLRAGAGFELLHGDFVIELKSIRVDKGRALAALMTEPPFAGRQPWMLGDDFTDEPAFAMAQALGGTGVIVGARQPTAAHASLADVAAARAWLACVAAHEHRSEAAA